MRVLVTGGAGFIGSNLVDALLERGDEVVVLDDLSTGDAGNLAKGVDLRVGDVTDLQTVATAAAGCDAVFHLAAQIDVRKSVANPVLDLQINAGGTLTVLSAAKEAGAGRVVYASTGGAIYGEADTIPTPEDAPARPLAPYGQSKLSGEGYCRLFSELYGLRATSLRFANVYGPRQDPLGEGGVIAIFCGLALDGGTPVIYGDGDQTRDFIYVGDVVSALLRAADGAGPGPFNVGTGAETSVNDLARQLSLITGTPFLPRYEPERPGEVLRSCLDPSRAAADLDWRAATTLDEGLRLTLDWARSRH
jgi:UDP-glucose 4-epimerase